jgi:cob(I)alamin adenosyltransferase
MPSRPRHSKLYTRRGDRGETNLLGTRRVPKDHPRVTACGTVDELNTVLGLAISSISQRTLAASLQAVQKDLFDVGADLSDDRGGRQRERPAAFRIDSAKTRRLEALIDEYDARLPALRNFVLPSGSSAASLLHLARAVCRRAERTVVALARAETVNPAILPYLNRLSDLLFVLARYVNKAARRRELLWRDDR